MVREIGVQSQVESYQKLKKMVLHTVLLNPQHYKWQIKLQVEQSWERSSVLPQHLSMVAIEKEAFGSPSPNVANFTYFYKYICIQQLCIDTRCSLEDLPKDNRDGWRERKRKLGKSVLAAQPDNDDDDIWRLSMNESVKMESNSQTDLSGNILSLTYIFLFPFLSNPLKIIKILCSCS